VDFNSTARRKNATRETTSTLKTWLYEHRKNPYPTKGEKIMLAIITKMTLTQVSTWFANARRRLKKENKMTWSPKTKGGEDHKEDLEKTGPVKQELGSGGLVCFVCNFLRFNVINNSSAMHLLTTLHYSTVQTVQNEVTEGAVKNCEGTIFVSLLLKQEVKTCYAYFFNGNVTF